MKDFVANIKRTWENRPVETLAVAALTVIAASKLITAVAQLEGSRAYAKDVNRRVKNSR
jgi:hypothetical protein